MSNLMTSNMKKAIEYFKHKTGFYKLGRDKYFERLNNILLLCIIIIFITGKILKRYNFDNIITNTLNIILPILIVLIFTAMAFSIRNNIRNNKKHTKSTFIASLPYLLMVLTFIIVIAISAFL